MSEYTTEVRFICETLAGHDMSQGYGKVSEIIDNSWDKVFDFDFPIFDSAYRSVLCKKILMHYYTREIGFETVGLWKLKLNMKMNEIMPYYNKLYASETYTFNPLYDADYTKSHEGEDSGNSSDDSTHTGTIGDAGVHNGTVGDSFSKLGNVDDSARDVEDKESWNTYSDTPQGALTNVANETYLTDARKITEDNVITHTNNRDYDETGSNTRTYNEATGNTRTFNEANGVDREYSNTNEYVERVVGKMPGKSYSKMIMEYRESLINIDMMVINELNKLFMLVW